MRHLVILAWCTSLAAAFYSEHIMWDSESVLQARQFSDHLNFPRVFPLQARDGFRLTSRSYTLQPRTNQPTRTSPKPQAQSRARTRSPSPVRADVRAVGPATISMAGGQGEQNHLVASYKMGQVQDKSRSSIRAGAKSTNPFSVGTFLQAEARGGVVMAQVIPHQGSVGSIQFHGNGETRDAIISNQSGQWHIAESFGSGKAVVRAHTLGGGEVNVIAYNQDKRERD